MMNTLFTEHALLFYLLVFIVGLVVGSILKVLIYGRKPTSLRYPIIELLTALLFIAILWQSGPTMYLLWHMIFVAFLICMTGFALKQPFLPDFLTIGFLWAGLIANTQIFITLLPHAVHTAAGTWLFLWLSSRIYTWLTGKSGIKQENINLIAAFGAWFGVIDLPFIVLFAGLSLGIFKLIRFIFHKCLSHNATTESKNSTGIPMPFAPFLCLGGLLVLFFEEQMLNFYMGLAFYLMYLIFG